MIYDVKKNRVIYFDTRHWEVMGKLLPARLVEYLAQDMDGIDLVYAVKPD